MPTTKPRKQSKGLIRGPGGPKDDAITRLTKEGTFILPVETVQAIGVERLNKLVESTRKGQPKQQKNLAAIRVSDGEFAVPPESVQGLGLANIQPIGLMPSYALGGEVEPTGTLSAVSGPENDLSRAASMNETTADLQTAREERSGFNQPQSLAEVAQQPPAFEAPATPEAPEPAYGSIAYRERPGRYGSIESRENPDRYGSIESRTKPDINKYGSIAYREAQRGILPAEDKPKRKLASNPVGLGGGEPIAAPIPKRRNLANFGRSALPSLSGLGSAPLGVDSRLTTMASAGPAGTVDLLSPLSYADGGVVGYQPPMGLADAGRYAKGGLIPPKSLASIPPAQTALQPMGLAGAGYADGGMVQPLKSLAEAGQYAQDGTAGLLPLASFANGGMVGLPRYNGGGPVREMTGEAFEQKYGIPPSVDLPKQPPAAPQPSLRGPNAEPVGLLPPETEKPVVRSLSGAAFEQRYGISPSVDLPAQSSNQPPVTLATAARESKQRAEQPLGLPSPWRQHAGKAIYKTTQPDGVPLYSDFRGLQQARPELQGKQEFIPKGLPSLGVPTDAEVRASRPDLYGPGKPVDAFGNSRVMADEYNAETERLRASRMQRQQNRNQRIAANAVRKALNPQSFESSAAGKEYAKFTSLAENAQNRSQRRDFLGMAENARNAYNNQLEAQQAALPSLLERLDQDAQKPRYGQPISVLDQSGQPALIQMDNWGNIRPVEGYSPQPTMQRQPIYEQTLQRERAKNVAARERTNVDLGAEAASAFGKIGKLREMIGDTGFINNALAIAGTPINSGGASTREAFDAISNSLVLDTLGGGLGAQISNSDREFIKNTVASFGKTPEGNRQILDNLESFLGSKYRQLGVDIGGNQDAVNKLVGGILSGQQPHQQGNANLNTVIGQMLQSGMDKESVFLALEEAGY